MIHNFPNRFPWLPNHGSIEAEFCMAFQRRVWRFRGYRTTAPLKPATIMTVRMPRYPFPWLPNHGSIEANSPHLYVLPSTPFPWLPNHGSIEAGLRATPGKTGSASFRGYRTTAPLKLHAQKVVCLWIDMLFPWLPNHGSIEARPSAIYESNPTAFPWLPNHGSIEALWCSSCRASRRKVSVVTEPRLH